MSRQAIAPAALAVMAVVCTAVAAAAGYPVWAAAVGGGLAVAYWGLEALAWRRARRVSLNGAIAVALGGMALRLAAVLGVLVVVALLDRAAFSTAALSFLAGFTVYTGLRLFLFAGDQGGEARVP